MSEPTPIETIRAALGRMHRYATGQTRETYMSIPASRSRDADLILHDAIEELERLRSEVAEARLEGARAALEAAAERLEERALSIRNSQRGLALELIDRAEALRDLNPEEVTRGQKT